MTLGHDLLGHASHVETIAVGDHGRRTAEGADDAPLSLPIECARRSVASVPSLPYRPQARCEPLATAP